MKSSYYPGPANPKAGSLPWFLVAGRRSPSTLSEVHITFSTSELPWRIVADGLLACWIATSQRQTAVFDSRDPALGS